MITIILSALIGCAILGVIYLLGDAVSDFKDSILGKLIGILIGSLHNSFSKFKL